GAAGELRRRPAPQAPRGGSPRGARGHGAVGVAALRAERGVDAGRDRSPPDADRMGGDAPLHPRRQLQPPRVPQEQ
ncbi:hypothetical protein ABTP42_19940, partial [Acinetobacter baumannii]